MMDSPHQHGFVGGGVLNGLAVEDDRSRVFFVDAGEDLHESGLASTILSDHAVNRAAPDIDRDAVQGPDPGEGFCDVFDGQDNL